MGSSIPTGYTASDLACDDDCDSPEYTLISWARAAIDGRNYRRRTGPDVRFAFRMRSGLILEVLPQYQKTDEWIAALKEMGISDPTQSVDSNWQPCGDYDLRIYARPKSKRPLYLGYFDGWDEPLVTSGPQAVTDDALSTLWRVHRSKDQAFMGMPICGCCRRVLTDELSRKLGIGPDCARRLGIQHSAGSARAVELEARA